MKLVSHIKEWHCAQQPVFVRADLNVLLQGTTLINDRRLKGIQPTLDALIKKEAIIILASHIGRPQDKEPQLSTRLLVPWFEQHGYTIVFCESIKHVKEQEQKVPPGTILLLENLRFFPGEKNKDTAFIHALRSLAEWYVNDAFGTLHREDASLAALADTFPPDHRSIGYLVEKEIKILSTLMHNPRKPFCMIIGGGKIPDKIEMIAHLFDTIDYLLLCPAMVFTFALARGQSVGQSLIDEAAVKQARDILQQAERTNTEIIFPVDYEIARGSLSGSLEIVAADQFPEDGIGVSIGPEALAIFNTYIQKSGTIFYNGMMGFADRPATLDGLKALLTDIASTSGTSIIAGGDSIAVADQLSLEGINYYSTGGGATLAYLSGKQLPALAPFY